MAPLEYTLSRTRPVGSSTNPVDWMNLGSSLRKAPVAAAIASASALCPTGNVKAPSRKTAGASAELLLIRPLRQRRVDRGGQPVGRQGVPGLAGWLCQPAYARTTCDECGGPAWRVMTAGHNVSGGGGE